MTTWRTVLNSVREDSSTAVDALLAAVQSLPSYSAGRVSEDELRVTASASLDELLVAASGGLERHPDRLTRLAVALGRRRARQHVPAEEMAQALRMDFEVLWSAVRRHASRDQETAVVACLHLLWRSVEEYACRAQRAYLREAELMARECRASLAAQVNQLFTLKIGRERAATHVAEMLGVPPHARFEVVVACGAAAWELAEVAAVANTDRSPPAIHQDGDSTTMFWSRTGAPLPPPLRDLLDELPAGSASASALVDVPEAAQTARAVARSLPEGYRGSVSIDEAWPFVARQALADIGHVGDLLAPLTALPTEERDRLVDTVGAVLAHGSVVGAARALYCHRNTVLGRLRRFRDLTGLDLSRSQDLAMAVVLFAGS